MVELRHVEEITHDSEMFGAAAVPHPVEELQKRPGLIHYRIRIPLTPRVQMHIGDGNESSLLHCRSPGFQDALR